MIVTAVFNSSQAQSLHSAYVVLSKYPDATMLDTSGLNTASIDSLIATVAATSQNRIYALVDVGTNPPSGNLTAGQITALDGKLATTPGSDAATIEIDATSGTPVNDTTNRAVLAWNSVYPTDTPAYSAVILGRKNFWIQVATATATAGAAGTITDSAAQFDPDLFVNLWVEIVSGTGAGQIRQILTNSATVITVTSNWTTNPDNTSVYRIRGYKESETVVLSGQAATSGGVDSITDSTATYVADQYVGYTVRITDGTGAGQEVMVVDNNGTLLRVATDWGVAPDNTSIFDIVQYSFRNTNERLLEAAQTATSGGGTTIVVSTQAWPTNVYTGSLVRIVGGVGSGQIRYIASNTATTLTVTQAWGTNPDSTSEFEIYQEGGSWPYILADFYLDLAMTYYTDITDSAHVELFNSILGKKTASVAQDEGKQQNLEALGVILERGKVIYDYLNPA